MLKDTPKLRKPMIPTAMRNPAYTFTFSVASFQTILTVEEVLELVSAVVVWRAAVKSECVRLTLRHQRTGSTEGLGKYQRTGTLAQGLA